MPKNWEDTLKKRGRSYEAKYKFEEEIKFKTAARRNRLLGLWAAERLGMGKEEGEAFAKDVVIADLQEPGVEDIIRKIKAEFDRREVKIRSKDIRSQLKHLDKVARDQVTQEHPKPLGPDHEGVGD